MPLEMRLVAIRPGHSPMAISGLLSTLIDRQLGEAGFAGDMIRAMANYPPALPWTSRPPRKGPRRGGRRTGALGRGWRITRRDRRFVFIEVANRVRYTVHVQGPRIGPRGRRQTFVMKQRNWQNIQDESLKVWRKHRRAILGILKQNDRRLRRRRIR